MNRLDIIIDKHVCWKIHDLLQELKKRRESELRPADKFLGSTVAAQWEHFTSELEETIIELSKWLDKGIEESFDRSVEEIIDMQMSLETLLAILGLDEQQRMDARCKVIEKNRLRGYYEDGGKV